MRVKIKGINKVAKRLADGTKATYYYAWKGGPRLPGKPGDPVFIAAYNEAIATKADQPIGTIQSVLNAYQASPKFADLADRTRKDYIRNIRQIEAEFSAFPIEALTDRRCRGEFFAWRDRLAAKSRRQADYVYATLASIFAWAVDRGMVPVNPCERPGKLYTANRAEIVWSEADEATFLAIAPQRLHLAYLLAVWTGQRQGDLVRLTWAAYDGTHIAIRQSKTKARIKIPVAAPLKAALDATPKVAVTILATTRKTSWTSDGFRTSWYKAVRKAKIKGPTFHDLRGTAVTRFALSGCSNAEIASFIGHDLDDVARILDAHYLHRDPRLAESALKKRETHEARTKIPN
jgi:integrase